MEISYLVFRYHPLYYVWLSLIFLETAEKIEDDEVDDDEDEDDEFKIPVCFIQFYIS